MCLLSFMPTDIQPDFDELCHGIQADPDGSGFVIATNSGNLIIEKAAPAESVLGKWQADLTPMYDLAERFCALRKRHPELPAMFHSRYGTSGLYGTYNVHPFLVGKDKRTVVAHNGVISALSFTNTDLSDTHIFAKKVMPQRFPKLDSKRTQRKLAAYLGKFNKIAIITTNPAYKANGYLINSGSGVFTKSGVWHSNSDYLKPVAKGYLNTSAKGGRIWYPGTGWEDETANPWSAVTPGDDTDAGAKAAAEEWTPDCTFCQAYLSVSKETNVCGICRTCQDCAGIEGDDCDCWYPGSEGKDAHRMLTDDEWNEIEGLSWEEYLQRRDQIGRAAVASVIPAQSTPVRLAIEAPKP